MRCSPFVFCLALFVCASSYTQAAEKAPVSSAKIKSIIRDLGATKFARREQATQQLIKIGSPAIKDLEQARRSYSDQEIQLRLRRVLQIIHARDLASKLGAFKAGKISGDSLAGWKRFRSLAGNSLRSRRLFVQMQEAQPALFSLLQAKELRAAQEELERATAKTSSRSQFGYPISLGKVAALLFVAGETKIKLGPSTSLVLANLCFVPSFASTLEGGPKTSILRSLIGRVVVRNTAEAAHPYWLMLGMDHSIKSALVPAKRILKAKKTNVTSVEYALLTLAKFGNQKDVALATKFVADKRPIRVRSVFINGQRRLSKTQMRDLAMAVVLYLEKRDITKFGFSLQVQGHNTRVFRVESLRFDNEKQRQAALKRFAQRAMKKPPG